MSGMETKNPPPMMTEKMPTTKPPTRSSAVSHVTSQGASVLIHERSITVVHPGTRERTAALAIRNFVPHALLPMACSLNTTGKIAPAKSGSEKVSIFFSCRKTASVHRKSEASHVQVEGGSRSPRIFDNEV